MSEPSTQPVRAGDILVEKYRVERVLGQGGMGVVVLAEHIELRERVAIKFLLDTTADNGELAERFLREARASVKIKSEHVVRVVDVGRLPTRAPYMVMEYLEGEDLSQRLLAGRVPIEDAVDYVIQGCEAMHAAHRLGIVHRDLKPANLFLTQRPDGSSLIKVLDFGISKVKTLDAAQLSLTHTQAMMGSPLYMSPEQMRSSKDVSPSADIWSLGVILHELISGDVPFTGSTFPEVLVQVMSEPPTALRALRPEVPEGLEAVVLCCLEKDPADRYASVAALGVALSPYASSRTLGLQTRLRSSMSQPPAAAAAAPASVLIRTVEHAPLQDLGAAIAPTAPAPALKVATPAVASAREHTHAKTNTAWGAQSAASAAPAGVVRRRWLLAGGGALGVLAAIISAFVLRPADGARASVAAPAAVPVAAPELPVAPVVQPALEPPPRPSEPRVEPVPPELSARDDEAPVPADRDSPAIGEALPERAPEQPPAALDEHMPAAPPTASAAAPRATAARQRAALRAAMARAPQKGAGARLSATASTETNAPAQAARPSAPKAPPPASGSTRSKPLSIEFK